MWTVIRQPRKSGAVYLAQWKGAGVGKRKAVTIGSIPSDPPTLSLSSRLRALDPEGRAADALVIALALAPTDEEARALAVLDQRATRAMAVPSLTGRLGGSTGASPPPPSPKGVRGRGTPISPYGAMTLREYHDRVWWPVRSAEIAIVSQDVEGKKWEAILPVLGDYRVCDLDAPTWASFLLTKESWGPTTRRLAQNAYRQALQHAVEIGAISSVHAFRPVRGTGRPQKEGRALSDPEVVALLDAAPSEAHRALYAVMVGQGLRPGEAVALTWSQWDFLFNMLRVGGTKNRQAALSVPLTPLTIREITLYWESLGRPTSGPCFLWRGRPIHKLYSGFVAAALRAGLGKVKPYDLRHTFATSLARNRVTRAAARRMMRHSSVSVILERAYEHLEVDDLATEVARLPDLSQ